MTLDITQFYQTFFDEADELLAQMEQLLLNLDIAHPDPEDLAAIFRAAHSIKGGAATFGFTALTETTHILESLLDRARNNELVLRKDMIDTFLETKDVLSGQLSDYRASAEPDAAVAKAICARLEYLYNESRGVLPAGATPPANAAPAPAAAPAAAVAVAAAAPEAPQGARPPEHVVEQAVQAAGEWNEAEPAVTGGQGGPHLKITLRGVGEKVQELLTEELGNLGRIVGQVKTGSDLTLWLDSDVSSDDIVAVCCFVIDESQIVIGRGAAPVDETQEGEPGAPEAAPPAPAFAESTAGGGAGAPSAAVSDNAAPAPAAPPAASVAPAAPAAAPAASAAAATAAAAPAAPAAPAETERKAAARPAAAASAEGSSIRVGVEKVDQLINLV